MQLDRRYLLPVDLLAAQNRLLVACARRSDFQLPGVDRSQLDRITEWQREYTRPAWWSPSLSEARGAGYGLGGILSTQPVDPEAVVRRYVVGLSTGRQERLDEVLWGRPRDAIAVYGIDATPLVSRTRGCWAESQGLLYGHPRRWARLSNTALNVAVRQRDEMLRAPGFASAREAWARCVAPVSPGARLPIDVRFRAEDARSRVRVPSRLAVEVRIASRDARCSDMSRLREIGPGASEWAARRIVRRYEPILSEYDKAVAAARVKARGLGVL